MKSDSKRIYMLDEIRGFAIICMVFHHTFLDIGDVLGLKWGYVIFDALCTIQPLFWALFIVISGICSRLSRNTLKRGIIVFACAAAITAFTVLIMPLFGFAGSEIYFGILHCLGICMIITGLAMPVINRIDYRVGALLSALLFFFTYGINSKTMLFGLIHLPESWYEISWLYPIGICSPGFKSADYFSVIPWIFIFLFGAFIGQLAKEQKFPSVMYKKRSRFLCFVGKNSLWIYLAHQPVIYAVMIVISLIML